MKLADIRDKGLVLLGCGKMGSALLAGWLKRGLAPGKVWVIDPHPSDWLKGMDGLHLNAPLPEHPGLVLIAVKPQMMADALPTLAAMGNGDTVFLSIAAGIPIRTYLDLLGSGTPVVRAMPNTPAAVGQGITAVIGSPGTDDAALAMAEDLLSAVGQTVRLESEEQMDAVTAVSGSGPAYVFHMIEALAAAGEAEGLAPDLALRLAAATVAGAGALAMDATEHPSELRGNVTSPGGTAAAGLGVLMDESEGLVPLLRRTVEAAAARSRELGK